MPIIGAVLHLDCQPEVQQAALQFLAQHPLITVGEAQLHGLPVVIECGSRSEERALWDTLEAHPGILFCSVAYADFSDIEGEL